MLENVFSKVYNEFPENFVYVKFILPLKTDKSGPNVRNGGHIDDVILTCSPKQIYFLRAC